MLSLNQVNLDIQIKSKPILEYKIRQSKSGKPNPPLLILLHGVGSNENSLFQLADYLDEDYMIISARAPFTKSQGSYKWYDVDFSTGAPVINAVQAEESRKIVLQFIEDLKQIHQFDEKKVFVGGFSQGAIMSYSIGLTRPDKVAGIITLSGRMLQEVKPIIAKKGLNQLKALLIHGKGDNVLPIHYARTAKEYLISKAIMTDYYELELGHSINEKVIQLFNQWLQKVKTNR